MITIENLKKAYGNEVVLDIDRLEIPPGQCFGLVGNNGAGKTTLFRLMLDMIRPTDGKVLINGRDVREDEEWKRYVGSYLDEHSLVDFLTPNEFFRFLAKIYNLSSDDLKNHLGKFEDLFQGEILNKNKYIRDLSRGNMKKVGIASAMIAFPDIVMLDEPFENLDPSSQIKLKKMIHQEMADRKVTFLISSHDLNHVTDVCERIVLLEKGKAIKDIAGDENTLATLEAYFQQ